MGRGGAFGPSVTWSVVSVRSLFSCLKLGHALEQPASAMPTKRFSLADAQAKGALTKKTRLEQARDGSPTLIAVARPWGSAFLAFEGAAMPKASLV